MQWCGLHDQVMFSCSIKLNSLRLCSPFRGFSRLKSPQFQNAVAELQTPGHCIPALKQPDSQNTPCRSVQIPVWYQLAQSQQPPVSLGFLHQGSLLPFQDAIRTGRLKFTHFPCLFTGNIFCSLLCWWFMRCGKQTQMVYKSNNFVVF